MSGVEKFKKDPYTRRFNVGPDFREEENDNWSTSTAESGNLRSAASKALNRSVKTVHSQAETNTSVVTVTTTQETIHHRLRTPYNEKTVSTVTPATEEYNANGNVNVRQSITADDSNIDTPDVFHPRQMVLSDSFDSTSLSPGKTRSYRPGTQISGSDEVLRDSKSGYVSQSLKMRYVTCVVVLCR